MRIYKIHLEEKDTTPVGLKEFKSSKFNNTIAFVGKNGSGKTRFLKLIENRLKDIDVFNLINDDFIKLPARLVAKQNTFLIHEKVLNAHKKYTSLTEQQKRNKNSVDAKLIATALEDYRNSNSRDPFNFNQLPQINQELKSEFEKYVKIIRSSDFRNLKGSFDSKMQSINTFQNIIDSIEKTVEVDEISMISETALSYLKKLPHKLVADDINTRGDEKKFRNRVSYKRFIILKNIISNFLEKDLEWNHLESDVNEQDEYVEIKATGFWTLNGREFNYNDFSEGEKVLFTYAMLLFLLSSNPNIKFNESIIIIDEPELNLHPNAQIKFIKSLQELIKDEGQLIIATHSLSIISNLDYDSIFLVRDGEIKTPASCIPYDSVDDLMGFNEHYHKMVEFLVSTPTWAMTNFMAQCFDNPDVYEVANPNDPQLDLFKRLIYEHDSLSILDFGAGKGRLLDKLKESESIWKRINCYDCYDIATEYNDLLKSKGASNVINNLSFLESGRYDLVMVVNVLHEIPVQEWATILNKLRMTLNENGIMAIIEDTKLPIGELPNENGFLILDKDEFSILLGDKSTFITPREERYKNRIICCIIHKKHMNIIDDRTIISALEKLKINSLNSIKEYRKQNDNKVSLGRLFALKSNLYLNSDIAIESLKS